MPMLQMLFETFEGRVVLGLTWLWLFGMVLDVVLQRSSADARAQLWLLISCAAMIVPLIALLTPSWRVGILTAESREPAPALAIEESPMPTHLDMTPPLPNREPVAVRPSEVQAVAPTEHVAPAPVALTRPTTPSQTPALRSQAVWLSPRTVLLGAWTGGVGLFCLRIALDWCAARRILKEGRIIEAPEGAAALAERMGLSTWPVYLETEAECAPACVGVWRPVILLPKQWKSWSDDSRRGVLAHEFAHLLRGDLLVQSWSLIVRALLWPHPVSWWAQRRMIVERERAADDLAREICEQPSQYAAALLEAAQTMARRQPALAISICGATPLEARVRRVLDDSAPRGRMLLHSSFALSLTLTISALASTTLSPLGAKLTAQERASKTAAVKSPEPQALKTDLVEKRFDYVEVTGTVFDPAGKPAEKVTLSTRVGDGRSTVNITQTITTTTDREGKFAISVHRDQVASMALLAVGSASRVQSYLKSPFGGEAKGEYWKDIVVQLEMAKPLAITVLDPNGEPAKSPKVSLLYPYPVPSPEDFTADERGIARMWIPNGLELETAIAYLEGVGVDYVHFQPHRTERVSSTPSLIPEQVELRLAKLVEIPVKVVDEQNAPIADTWAFPAFRRPGRKELLLRGDVLPQLLQSKTNENGEAIVFTAHDVDEPVSVSARHEYFAPIERSGRRYEGRTNRPTGFLWDPAKPGPVTVVVRDTRESTVTLRGCVVDKNGAGVANASVAASGQGYQRPMPFFKNFAYTDAKGEFSLSLSKNMFYVFMVETGDHLATQRSFTVGERAPAEPIVFQVEPTSAITIRAIDAGTAQVAPNSMVQVVLLTVGDYQSRYVSGDEQPKVHASPLLMGGRPQPTAWVFRGQTNDQGEFVCHLPKGKFQAIFFGSTQNDEIEFLVTGGPKTVEVFTNTGSFFLLSRGAAGQARPPKLPFKGKVVDADGTPIADAQVLLASRVPMMNADSIKTTTNAAGEFDVTRDPRATLLRVTSKDHSLTGAMLLTTTSLEATLQLAPAPRVMGQLIDAKTKMPLVGKKIEAARGGNAWSEGLAAAKAVTDDQGRFTLSPLIPGINYSISVVDGDISDPRTYSSATWASVIPESPGQTINFGEMLITESEPRPANRPK